MTDLSVVHCGQGGFQIKTGPSRQMNGTPGVVILVAQLFLFLYPVENFRVLPRS